MKRIVLLARSRRGPFIDVSHEDVEDSDAEARAVSLVSSDAGGEVQICDARAEEGGMPPELLLLVSQGTKLALVWASPEAIDPYVVIGERVEGCEYRRATLVH